MVTLPEPGLISVLVSGLITVAMASGALAGTFIINPSAATCVFTVFGNMGTRMTRVGRIYTD